MSAIQKLPYRTETKREKRVSHTRTVVTPYAFSRLIQ